MAWRVRSLYFSPAAIHCARLWGFTRVRFSAAVGVSCLELETHAYELAVILAHIALLMTI